MCIFCNEPLMQKGSERPKRVDFDVDKSEFTIMIHNTGRFPGIIRLKMDKPELTPLPEPAPVQNRR